MVHSLEKHRRDWGRWMGGGKAECPQFVALIEVGMCMFACI